MDHFLERTLQIPPDLWPPDLPLGLGRSFETVSYPDGQAGPAAKGGWAFWLVYSENEKEEGMVALRHLLPGATPSDFFAFLPEFAAFTWRHLEGKLQATHLCSLLPERMEYLTIFPGVIAVITETVGEGSFQERCSPVNTMDPFFIKQMSENKSNSSFRDKLIALFFFSRKQSISWYFIWIWSLKIHAILSPVMKLSQYFWI